MTKDERNPKPGWSSIPALVRPLVSVVLVLLAGCATAPKPSGSFPVKISSSPPIEITSATARVEPYGLVVTGRIHCAPNLPAATMHSVDISITGPDGREIRKFTSQYFPAPKPDKKKPQRAHFTMVTYAVPPAGSVIKVSLTTEPKPGQPEEPTPENR